MPKTHKRIVLEERMELLHSIIVGRQINIGRIIIEETFKYIEKDEALPIKGTMIAPATWRGMSVVPTFPVELFVGSLASQAIPQHIPQHLLMRRFHSWQPMMTLQDRYTNQI
ncbi:hypothetical protein V6N11_047316 [Hibiscus sabdariffa]|uniref:DNA-directed RNA polymerase n=1 Tax=Hibiscus sabdariffa TaxID=183260 RepID=A0ABR2PBL9_9ROSI